MSTEVPRNGPPGEDENPLSKLEQDFGASDYTQSIENFYVAQNDFLNEITYIIKTTQIENGIPKSDMSFSLIPIAESFGEVIDQINRNEPDWDRKSEIMAGFMWSERKKRALALNSILKKPVPYTDSGTTALDEEEKCADDAYMVDKFRQLLNRAKDAYIDDAIIIQQLKQGYMHEIVTLLNTVFNRYTMENPNQEVATGINDIVEEFEMPMDNIEETGEYQIARMIGKRAIEIATITASILLAKYLSKKFNIGK